MKNLIFAALMVMSPAYGLDIEVAVGRSEFCCRFEGVWWGGYGFNGNTISQTIEIGARKRFGDFGFHFAYVDLGTASGLNPAAMRDDEFGRLDFTKPCDVTLQKNCLGYFDVRQHIQGVLLGGSYGKAIKGVRVEAELGQYFYQTELSVSIWCPNCGIGHKYAFGGSGSTFTSKSGIRRSNYISIRAEYKDFFLTYRRFSHIDGNGGGLNGAEEQFATGLTSGPVNQVMIGVKF